MSFGIAVFWTELTMTQCASPLPPGRNYMGTSAYALKEQGLYPWGVRGVALLSS